MRHISGCEIDRHCSKVLMQRDTSHTCLFKDILDFCPGLPSWQELRELNFQDRFNVVKKHFRQKNRACWRHQTECSGQLADLDVSGSPCPPWSYMGPRQQLSDQRSLLLLVWMASILTLLPLVAVHENTLGFKVSCQISTRLKVASK